MTVEVGVLLAIAGFLIGLFTFNRKRDNDVKKEASKDGAIETKLDYIGQSVDSIRIDLRASEQRWNSMSETLIRVDESTKQAHKRIDKIENKGEF